MYHVYVLQSQVDRRLYVGFSQRIDKRLKEHNAGYVFSTQPYTPWELVYCEVVTNRVMARKREKYFKSGSGKEFLMRMLRGKLTNGT